MDATASLVWKQWATLYAFNIEPDVIKTRDGEMVQVRGCVRRVPGITPPPTSMPP